MKKLIFLIVLILVLGCACTAYADAIYFDEGYREISPQGCVYWNSNHNIVFSNDGRYLLAGPGGCMKWRSNWYYEQTDIGKQRAQIVKNMLSN